MRKFLTVMVLAGFIVLTVRTPSSYASEVDVLLQKLVEKGVLSSSEAQEIRTETNEEIAKQDKEKQEDYKKLAKDTLPAWVQNTKLKGDFRLRYQLDKDKGQEDENRARIRARFGLDTKVNDQVKAGIGIATGKLSDPRSTNVTLGLDSSSTNNPGSFKDITLDYAYGQYTPFNWLTLTGGKFKNPLWQPNDLIWDGDLNPEGVAAQLSYKLSPQLELFMNDLFFTLFESRTDTSDAFMAAFQPGFNYSFTNNLSLKAAAAFYLFNSVEGQAKFTKQATNTLVGSNYQYNYDSINPSLELGLKKPFSGFVPYTGLFADYIYNTTNPASGKDGFDFGLKLGNEKIEDKGQWQTKLLYAKLGKDAFLDIFPDSDRYNGKTNMKSYEAIFEYGLGKNTSLGLDYYYAESLTANSNGSYLPQQVLQVDWNLKF